MSPQGRSNADLETDRLAPAIFHFFKKLFNPDKGLPD